MRWQIISDEGLKKRPDFRLHIRSIPNIISLHHKLFLMAIGMYIGTYIHIRRTGVYYVMIYFNSDAITPLCTQSVKFSCET